LYGGRQNELAKLKGRMDFFREEASQ
jgi:hypothetical protein